MMRAFFLLSLICVLTSNCVAATADIIISSANTPETTSLTIDSAAIVGTVSALNFPASPINYSVLETSTWSISATGVLSRKAGFSINFETPTISLPATVTAADKNGPTTVTKVFTIIIVDVNEPPSNLAISSPSCAEESLGATIGTLTRDDVDANDTATFSVPVNSGYRIILPNTLALDTTKKLDFEDSSVRGSYASRSVTVTVTDSGGLTATLNVTVTPTDANDAPTQLALSGTSCSEESLGATIGTLTSNDVDANDTAAYSVPGNSGYRIIFPNTLALDTDRKLDFENSTARGNYASRLVTVTVTDSGGLTATLNVTVTPTNVNEAPTGLAISGSSCLEESLGATIGTLTRNDVDANDTATYSVPANSGYRIILTNTLALDTTKKLDFENSAVRGSYASRSVAVTVTDSGGLTTTLDVTVNPTDVNEAPTVVEVGDGGSVNENDAGVRIAGLRNDDPDAGDTITYSLVNPAGPFIIAGSELRLKTGAALNFEAGASIPVSIIASDALGLSCTSSMNITVIDQNDTPTLPTWATTSLAVIDASANLPLASAADELFDEDKFSATAGFRDYNGSKLQISFSTTRNDKLNIEVPTDLQAKYLITNGVVFSQSEKKNVAQVTVSKQDQSDSQLHTFTVDVKQTSTLSELLNLLRMVSFSPDRNGLSTREPLSATLSIFNPSTQNPGWTKTRSIDLSSANVPPVISSGVTIPVLRFSQVNITPEMLGITDEHQELGLTLFIDYRTLNGKLYTSTSSAALDTGQSVPVVYIPSTATPSTGSLSLDLFYVPDTGNSATEDACFFSVKDHGSKPGVASTSWLRTPPIKVSFDIQAGAVPVVKDSGAPAFLEGSDPIAIVDSKASVELSGTTDPDKANFGGWNLYVSYNEKNYSTGPGNATEILAVHPQGFLVVEADGRTVKLNNHTIAQIDASANGSESALLLILSPDIVGSEVLTLAKALTYRDSSPRLPLIDSDPNAIRRLFLGFVQKSNAATFAGVLVSVTRKGTDTPPVFTDGSRRTVITVSNEPILGSSVLADIDTNLAPNVLLWPVPGDPTTVSPRATVAFQRGPEDTTKTYRTTIGWKLQRDRDVVGDQDFILQATIGNTTLRQTITLSPRSGSDLGLAIASDAPLALIKPAGAAEPIKRALRVRRGAASVDDASFFLLGTTIPPWITIDSTAGTMTYDLANKEAVAGATYRFSVLATAGTTAAEQPVVLRVVAQPVQSGTN